MSVKRSVKWAGALLALVCVAGAALCIGINVGRPREPELTNELVTSRLEAVSELTTARLTYNGLLHYEEGTVPLLTRKAFFMVYQAEVSAWVDLSEARVEITDETVRLTVPRADETHIDLHVVPDSITFYNEAAALLNWESKEDAVKAIAKAEEDVLENAGIAQLLETADAQTAVLLEQLFADDLGGRSLELHYA